MSPRHPCPSDLTGCRAGACSALSGAQPIHLLIPVWPLLIIKAVSARRYVCPDSPDHTGILSQVSVAESLPGWSWDTRHLLHPLQVKPATSGGSRVWPGGVWPWPLSTEVWPRHTGAPAPPQDLSFPQPALHLISKTCGPRRPEPHGPLPLGAGPPGSRTHGAPWGALEPGSFAVESASAASCLCCVEGSGPAEP